MIDYTEMQSGRERRCALQGSNPPSISTAIPEGRIITFRDYDPWYKRDETGFNKVGYITRSETVLYPFCRWLRVTALSKVTSRKHVLLALGPAATPNLANIEVFFTQNRRSVHLFFMGLRALNEGDFTFFKNPIRLPILGPLPPGEWEERWKQFVGLLCPGDLVFVIDTHSVVSRLIAVVDQGTWSHVGCYVGGGRVCEAITAGVVERPINVYRSLKYRLGIYRPFQLSEADSERVIARMRSIVGHKYNFYRIFRLAVMTVLGVHSKRSNSHNVSPNDLVLGGKCRLIFVV